VVDGVPSSGAHQVNKKEARNLGDVVQTQFQAAAAGNIVAATWAQLVATPGSRVGQPGQVSASDAGTHTDPVVGGTVPNSGEYRWSGSAWQRTGDVIDPATVAEDIIDATDSKVNASLAKVEASAQPSLNPSAADVVAGKSSTYLGGVERDGTISPARRQVMAWSEGASPSRSVYLQPEGLPEIKVSRGDAYAPTIDGDFLLFKEGVVTKKEHIGGLSTHALTCTKLLHVIVNGQSTALGALNNRVVHKSVQWPGRVLMFNAGARILGHRHEGSFQITPVKEEGLRHFTDYAEVLDDGAGETMGTGIATAILESLPSDTCLLISFVGVESAQYAALKSGTVPYENRSRAIERARIIAAMHGLAYLNGSDIADIWVQGEGDYARTQAAYEASMVELQGDITARQNLLFGGSQQRKLLMAQNSNWTKSSSTNAVPLAQLTASLNNPGKIYTAGPLYAYPTIDGTHFTAQGSYDAGYMIGRAFAALMNTGNWAPLYCQSAVRSGATVIMTFNVPSGSLAIDNPAIAALANQGLRWLDSGDGNAVSISGVIVSSANTLSVTLSAAPTGSNQRIGIGDSGTAGANGGPDTGPRTRIRDGATPPNCACHQVVNVTV